MNKKIKYVLEKVLESSKPSDKELKSMKESVESFKEKVKNKIKSMKINAEVFVGGSFAKNTVIKK